LTRFDRRDFVQRDAIGTAAPRQFCETGEVRRGTRHDELAAAVDRKTALDAVAGQPGIALARKAGFKAVGGIVEARVQDAAIPTARVPAPDGLFFEQGDAGAWVPMLELQRQADADDATADDEEVAGFQASASVRTGTKSARRRRGATNVCCSACTLWKRASCQRRSVGSARTAAAISRTPSATECSGSNPST